MHLRRSLLLLGLVLLVVAGVESLVAVPRESSVSRPAVAVPPSPAPAPRTVALAFPAPKRLPVVALATGAHAIVRVGSGRAGQIALGGLGRDAPVEPGTPASFDLLATRPGSYEVVFTPVGGGPAVPVGRLLVR